MAPEKPTKHRPHRPMDLGPRLFRRGRYVWLDLRPWGGERVPARNPAHPRWPDAGERTEDDEVADRWKWRYVDRYRDTAKRRQLGIPETQAASLGAEVTRFVAHCDRTLARRTGYSVRVALEVHLVPFVGRTTIVDSIEPARIQAWIDDLVDRDYAVTTIETYLAWARRCFRWRSDDRHDPTTKVELPRRGERDVEPWSDAELVKLRKAADRLDRANRGAGRPLAGFRLMLETAVATGCRVAELAALPWTAFNQGARTVRVRYQAAIAGGDSFEPLKGRRNRTALVLPTFWDFYRPRAQGRVLLASGAESVALNTFGDWFRELQEAAGVKRHGMNAHRSRHTYARICLEQGVRLEELQRFLGHKSIKTTEDSYGWMTDESATTLARARIYGEPIARPKLRSMK